MPIQIVRVAQVAKYAIENVLPRYALCAVSEVNAPASIKLESPANSITPAMITTASANAERTVSELIIV